MRNNFILALFICGCSSTGSGDSGAGGGFSGFVDDILTGIALGTAVVADVMTAESGTPSTSPSGSYTVDMVTMMANAERESYSPQASEPFNDGFNDSYGTGIAGSSGSGNSGLRGYSGGDGGDCANKETVFLRRMENWNKELANQNIGMCRSGEISRDMYREAAKLYRDCPILDPDGRQTVEFEGAVRQSEAVMRSSCTQEFLTANGF